MKLASEFIQLPLSFDVERLRSEVERFEAHDWDPHPLGYPGNSALPLVSAGGGKNNDYCGAMQATDALNSCPYITQVFSCFNTVIGRSRLMRLDPGCTVPPHSDTNYVWRKRIRIHIPIVTDPAVVFSSCDNIDVHMRAGEAWVFDNWRMHTVVNNSSVARIHLVVDTTGSADFWAMVRRGRDPRARAAFFAAQTPLLPFEPEKTPLLRLEQHNSMLILPPGEIDNLAQEFLEELRHLQSADAPLHALTASALDDFQYEWRSTWSLYADTQAGVVHYQSLILDLKKRLGGALREARLCSNGAAAFEVLDSWLDSAVDKKMLRDAAETRARIPAAVATPAKVDTSLFESPVFIVAAPRSGSTMLFELLQQNMELWTIGDESHAEFESIRALHPASHEFESNALGASAATPEVVERLFKTFTRKARNSQGTLFSMMPAETLPPGIRFLEKTPKNALRIPFLKAMFPAALFIFLHREPRQNLGAIIDAWHSGNFVTYPNLPGWPGPPWSLLLPPGWRDYKHRPLAEIAAHQWQQTNRTILNDLADIPAQHWCAVSYEDLLNNREPALKRLCDFANVPFGPRMKALCREALPLSKYTLTPPDPEKWRRYEAEIEGLMPGLEAMAGRLNDL